ncbi:hypothetical protein FF100_30260 [Methylobacterium terricola]|uniref:3-hydroxyacyl-CoA dehydrogenase C-terminal domain-containing protein n=1 Tax=Methylobacterium terricola TaxID=2583531 RepID=A0A5C4L7Y6_9HYPH|nr:hypothetical protein [Methylobacterium terricola]TNC08191.1 hypothetical protein FF100_30260 [Methylobacterium terricola]
MILELLAEGRAGRRAGAGFYDHDDDARRLWPDLSRYRRASDLTLAGAGERFLFAQIAEVLRAVRDLAARHGPRVAWPVAGATRLAALLVPLRRPAPACGRTGRLTPFPNLQGKELPA